MTQHKHEPKGKAVRVNGQITEVKHTFYPGQYWDGWPFGDSCFFFSFTFLKELYKTSIVTINLNYPSREMQWLSLGFKIVHEIQRLTPLHLWVVQPGERFLLSCITVLFFLCVCFFLFQRFQPTYSWISKEGQKCGNCQYSLVDQESQTQTSLEDNTLDYIAQSGNSQPYSVQHFIERNRFTKQ